MAHTQLRALAAALLGAALLGNGAAAQDAPARDPNFDPAKPVILYCGSGGRSALAGQTLQNLGYAKVYNLGAFKDWAEGGGAVEKA